MAKTFQIGDIVRVNNRSPRSAGLVGTVVRFDDDRETGGNPFVIKLFSGQSLKGECSFFTYKYTKMSKGEAMLWMLENS